MPQRNDVQQLARAVMQLIDTGHRRISRRIDLPRAQILGLLIEAGPQRPREIAAELGLTASATSRHLTALERDGAVAAEPDPADARTFLAAVTDAGRSELDGVTGAGAAVFAKVVGDWPDEDIATAHRLITALNAAWARHHATAAPTAAPTPSRRRRPGGRT
ncbi:MarR family winged helix-turn-helix transcriptional regulator [Dactylosporangium sp. CS-047395]|uniref:MarR family winged helix-turn-helix transcriptional regulator n=1 Tax=Dactylosporangium sp. CS-047395 TaxID=3239936 RepID=UPI003D92FE1A